MSKFTDQLKLYLKQDISDLSTLRILLDQEKESLKVRDNNLIEKLSQQKSQLVQQIESRSKLKARLIASSGMGTRPGEVESSLNTLNDDELMCLWKESRHKLVDCKEQNSVNGTIISRSLQRTNRLMMIVRGQNKTQNLYGDQGKEQNYGGSKRIGSA